MRRSAARNSGGPAGVSQRCHDRKRIGLQRRTPRADGQQLYVGFAGSAADPDLPGPRGRRDRAFSGGNSLWNQVLAADQRALSERFARKGHDRFDGLAWQPGATGVPLIPGALAAIECAVYSGSCPWAITIFWSAKWCMHRSPTASRCFTFAGSYRKLGAPVSAGRRSMSNPLSYLHDQLEQWRAEGTYQRLRILETASAAEARFDGKQVINLASNNYLGLTTHPKLREAALEAIRKFGVGSAARCARSPAP